jgi:hypothetical protein
VKVKVGAAFGGCTACSSSTRSSVAARCRRCTRSPRADSDGFLKAVDTYYGDVVLMDSKLLEMYDELLPQIDRVIGDRRQKDEGPVQE